MLRLAIGLGLVGAAAYAGRSNAFGASIVTGTDAGGLRRMLFFKKIHDMACPSPLQPIPLSRLSA